MGRARREGGEFAAAEGRRKRRRISGREREENAGFDWVRFRSLHHQTTGYKRDNKVLTMSKVSSAFLESYELKLLFDFQNITRILDMREEVYEEPVRVFYTNLMWDKGQEALRGYLRGGDFWIRANNIFSAVTGFHPDTPGLCKPCSNYGLFIDGWWAEFDNAEETGIGDVQTPPSDAQISLALTGSDRFNPSHICQTNMLSPIRIRLLEKIVRLILVPKGGDKAALTDLVKTVMICLLFRRPLDLSRLILDMMRECAKKKKRVLGYGKVITVLLRGKEFDFSPYRPMVLESPIDDEKVTAMTKGQKGPRVQGGQVVGQARVAKTRVQVETGVPHVATLATQEIPIPGPEGSGSVGGERVSAADFQDAVLELLAGIKTQLSGMRSGLHALEARVSWLVTVVEKLARVAGHESVLPRKDFDVPASPGQQISEDRAEGVEVGTGSSEHATVGEEVGGDGGTNTVGVDTTVVAKVEQLATDTAEGDVRDVAEGIRASAVGAEIGDVPAEEVGVLEVEAVMELLTTGPTVPMVVLKGDDGRIVVVPAAEASLEDESWGST